MIFFSKALYCFELNSQKLPSAYKKKHLNFPNLLFHTIKPNMWSHKHRILSKNSKKLKKFVFWKVIDFLSFRSNFVEDVKTYLLSEAEFKTPLEKRPGKFKKLKRLSDMLMVCFVIQIFPVFSREEFWQKDLMIKTFSSVWGWSK